MRAAALRRLAPRALVAAVAFVAAARLPDALSSAHAELARTATLSRAERELAAARSVDIDASVLEAAERLIPRGAVYLVQTGPAASVSDPVTLAAFPNYAAYWLLPRRQTLDPARAQWVVSYGGDLDATGLRFGRRVQVRPGIVIAEVRR